MLSTTFRAGSYPATASALRELAGDRAAGRARQSATPGVAETGQLTAAGVGQAASAQTVGSAHSASVEQTAGPGQAPGSSQAGKDGQAKGAGALGETRDAKDAEVIRQLAARDAEVRAHEAAHAAAGGAFAGSPSFGYQRGPDGKNYAVSGEVPIDISSIPGDPAATIAKMQQVKRAALAPASPSGADRSIAAAADASIAAARAELFANGGKDASKADGADKTQPDASRGDPAAATSGSNEPRDRQPESVSPGEVARDLFGSFAHRNAGLSAYQASSANAAPNTGSLASNHI